MNFALENKIQKLLQPHIPLATPGILLQVHQSGRKILDLAVGETFPYYDFASLTKPIFTVQALIWAYENKKWNENTVLSDILTAEQIKSYQIKNLKIKIVDILTHSAGFEWWRGLYKEISYDLPLEEKWKSFLTHSFLSVQETPADVSVYSDLGFLSLKLLIENMFNKSLKEVWEDVSNSFYHGFSLHFNENNTPTHDQKFYAPSERCPWRGRLLKGEVHDENAWMLNGISTHAGLFGSIDDLSSFGLQMRGNLLGIAKSPIKSKTMRFFLTRARPSQKGDWALGYMMPTPGGSSSGVYFSPYSVGHTGFTGTSFWFDPSTDLLVSILTNRVFWGRDKKDFTELRPQIHNWIIETLRRI